MALLATVNVIFFESVWKLFIKRAWWGYFLATLEQLKN